MMTRSKGNSKPENTISDLFADGVTISSKEELVERIGEADLNDILFAILANHQASVGRIAVLESRVSELEAQVSEMSDRALRQEAYSGRNTVILAGLPEPEDETPAALEKSVLSVLRKADPTISPADIGIAHRNARNKKRKSGPRTITCVLTKARNKDQVMRKVSRDKLKAADKVALYHWTSPGLRQRKEELEKVPGVKWVGFSGHRLFTVCVSSGGKNTFLKGVLNVQDITHHIQ